MDYLINQTNSDFAASSVSILLCRPISLILLFICCLLLTGCEDSDQWEIVIKDMEAQAPTLKHAYMTDEYIYKYGAIDPGMYRGDAYYEACLMQVYRLKKDVQAVEDLATFFNEIEPIKGQIVQDKGIIMVNESSNFESIWMPQSAITAEHFNPFGETVSYYQDPDYHPFYEDFLGCKAFLLDEDPGNQRKYILSLYGEGKEASRYDFDKTAYGVDDFRLILANPDTLVKLDIWCRSVKAYFLDLNRKFLVLMFINQSSGVYSPNPYCY